MVVVDVEVASGSAVFVRGHAQVVGVDDDGIVETNLQGGSVDEAVVGRRAYMKKTSVSVPGDVGLRYTISNCAMQDNALAVFAKLDLIRHGEQLGRNFCRQQCDVGLVCNWYSVWHDLSLGDSL